MTRLAYVMLGIVWLFVCGGTVVGQGEFVRGDVNHDGAVSISDAATLEYYLFLEGRVVGGCSDAADTEDDGEINIVDVMRIWELLFVGGPFMGEPKLMFPAPFPMPGLDTSEDELTCDEVAVVPRGVDPAFVIEVGRVEGEVGMVLVVPVFATTAAVVDGFSLALTYDPGKLSIEGFTLDGTIYDALGPQEYPRFAGWYGQRTAGHDWLGIPPPTPVPGEYVMGVLNQIGRPVHLPVLDEDILVNLKVRILSGEPGEELSITAGEGIHAPPVSNEFSVLGGAVYAATYPRMVKGAVQVRQSSSHLFRRGDSNGDGSQEIGDAVFLLSYLFANGGDVICLDAGDANDDGAIDIGDPIRILGHLFPQAGALAEPFGRCGVDLTEDYLDCGSFAPCE